MISEFGPKNIMISDFWPKNYGIAEWRFLSVSEFDGKSYSTSQMLLVMF